AVQKELLGKNQIKGKDYYKIKVTFDQQGGGNDYEDVYLYWIDQKTYKPTYLAYEFHVNGGGLRFREAYNERYVEGIRFVDYYNYKPKGEARITRLDALYENGELELLSDIELENIVVSPGNYN
ncbi:MAG: deoxyribose-phosphate aldolase, partial [Eudoraea sp.]|nr:deoxyribose-phosphate aldolase [Eudoraea sp.]